MIGYDRHANSRTRVLEYPERPVTVALPVRTVAFDAVTHGLLHVIEAQTQENELVG